MEALFRIAGLILDVNMLKELNLHLEDYNKVLKAKLVPILDYESTKFNEMIFEDLDNELHDISADHHTFIEDLLTVLNRKVLFLETDIIRYSKEVEVLISRYKKYKNTRRDIILKSILTDK